MKDKENQKRNRVDTDIVKKIDLGEKFVLKIEKKQNTRGINRSTIYKCNRTPTKNELDMLQNLYKEYDIPEEFYIKQPNRKKAYIKEAYGWTYKINDNKQFTFEKICNLINGVAEYHGFKMLSDYSHGTSLYTKMHSSVFVEDMMTMFADMYINLYRMVKIYCCDSVDEEFDIVTDELENIFHRFIQYEEEPFDFN